MIVCLELALPVLSGLSLSLEMVLNSNMSSSAISRAKQGDNVDQSIVVQVRDLANDMVASRTTLNVRFDVPMKAKSHTFDSAIKLQLLGRWSMSENGSVTRTCTSLLAGLTTLSHCQSRKRQLNVYRQQKR